MNYDFPRDEWEETIVKALDELNLIDTACRFKLRTPRRTPTRVRWTWSQKGGGQQYYLQPDYCMARKRDMQHIKGVDFWSPRYLHSDHRTVVATIKMGRGRRLKEYQCKRQKFPPTLPVGPRDANTTLFETLAAKCIKPKKRWAQGGERMGK